MLIWSIIVFAGASSGCNPVHVVANASQFDVPFEFWTDLGALPAFLKYVPNSEMVNSPGTNRFSHWQFHVKASG